MFTYFANNLHSASQQPELIDATLKDEDVFLDPFTS